MSNPITPELQGLRYALSEMLKIVTIFIVNGLNQDVTVQIKGGIDPSFSNSVDIGSPLTVPAGSTEARTLTPNTSGWLPYISVELTCATAPTSGSITVYRVRSKDYMNVIVNALEIRDTNPHNWSTDPDKISVVEW